MLLTEIVQFVPVHLNLSSGLSQFSSQLDSSKAPLLCEVSFGLQMQMGTERITIAHRDDVLMQPLFPSINPCHPNFSRIAPWRIKNTTFLALPYLIA